MGTINFNVVYCFQSNKLNLNCKGAKMNPIYQTLVDLKKEYYNKCNVANRNQMISQPVNYDSIETAREKVLSHIHLMESYYNKSIHHYINLKAQAAGSLTIRVKHYYDVFMSTKTTYIWNN